MATTAIDDDYVKKSDPTSQSQGNIGKQIEEVILHIVQGSFEKHIKFPLTVTAQHHAIEGRKIVKSKSRCEVF